MRRSLLTLLALVMLVPAVASAAPPKVTVSSPLLQFARPGDWVSVHVDFATTDATDVLILADFDGTDGIRGARRELSIAKNSKRRAVVTVPVPDWGSEITVLVNDRRGRPLAAEKLAVRGRMDPNTLHVVVVGEEPLGWPLLREITPLPVPGHADTSPDGFREVKVENVLPTDLPDQWFAWSPVDLVVWRRPDPAGLSPEQQAAFRGWIAGGGTAVVALGDNHANWTASPLADLTPLTSRSVVSSESAWSEVWALAGGPRPATGVEGGEEADARGLPVVEIGPSPGLDVVWEEPEGRVLAAVATPGTGRVVLLTFDPAAGELTGGFDRERFWRALLGLWAPPSRDYQLSDTWDGTIDTGGWRDPVAGKPFTIGDPACPTHGPAATAMNLGYGYPGGPDGATNLHRANLGLPASQGAWWDGVSNNIGDFAAAAPLSLYFILVFGALYLLCIGPLDYALLRRLRRPMLTWVTFPVLAVGFSVAAGTVISAQKAGDSESNCLALYDVMPDAGVVRGTAWCSIWASKRTDLVVDVPRGQGWTVPARRSDYGSSTYDPYSYQYDYYEDTPAIVGSGLRLISEPGHALLAWEAAQWSASSTRTQWIDREDGEVRWYVGADGEATVRNELGMDLVDAWIVDGSTFYSVGDLPTGSTRTAETDPDGPLAGDFSDDVRRKLFAWAYDAVDSDVGHLHVGTPGRPVLVGYARDAAGVPRFEGLTGVDTSQTFVRVPLPPLEESP